MVLKCLLFLFVLGEINAQISAVNCPLPRFDHGRYRVRQRSKLIKFICNAGYELVGNKYSNCRDGEWDVPLPICVRPGCSHPVVKNGVAMLSHGGAWAVLFCFPHHKLIGSTALYCDGRKWNDTMPSCVDASASNPTSCDFEDPHICGWMQDDIHDFDWKRWNKKTPSSFLFTGPSNDHTFGTRGSGYYMYIESTSKMENDTARLISPIYDASLAINGCFNFFYHMYGRTTGGLRIYQKPENMPLLMLLSDAERYKYLLFEKWGNQGDQWFNNVTMLKNTTGDFQIVIEGIRGTSFTSDIAIDDVAVLQGDNCTVAIRSATTPAVMMPDSCSGRCDLFSNAETELGCGCTASCVSDGNCCPDFFDVCVFDSSTTPESSPADQPQTQKLVASTTTTSSTTQTMPVTSTTTKKTQSPSTKKIYISSKTVFNYTKTAASIAPTKSTPKLIPTTLRPVTSTKAPTLNITRKIPTLVFKTSTPVYNKTGKLQPVTVKSETTKTIPTTILVTTPAPFTNKILQDRRKHNKEKMIEAHKIIADLNDNKSSGLKTAVACLAGLALSCMLVYAVIWAHSARGREALERLRGRTKHHADVAYLHTHEDEED